MTNSELLALGNRMVKKGRSSTEIYSALSYKASSNEQLNAVFNQIVMPDGTKNKRSPELTAELLKANRVKLKSDYSIDSVVRIALLVLTISAIVLFFSNEKVNNHITFGWFTLMQGLVLLGLSIPVRYFGKPELLLSATIGYFAIFGIELITSGIPSDLLQGYESARINIPGGLQHHARVGLAQVFGYLYPFVYLGVKLILGGFIFRAYFNYKNYAALPTYVKEELEDF